MPRKRPAKSASRGNKPVRSKGRVGSDRNAARRVGGQRDFGIPESKALSDYSRLKSEEAKFDPGGKRRRSARQPRSSAEGVRETGAGGVEAGPGASSGGDLDTNIIGVGTGGTGISQGGPDEDVSGPESTTGGSEEFASGPPARGEHQLPPGRVGGSKRVKGSTIDHSGGDATTTGQGAGGTIQPPVPEDVSPAGVERFQRRRGPRWRD